jgi:hypothetical protein
MIAPGLRNSFQQSFELRLMRFARSGHRCDVGGNVVRLIQLANDEKRFTCCEPDDDSDNC